MTTLERDRKKAGEYYLCHRKRVHLFPSSRLMTDTPPEMEDRIRALEHYLGFQAFLQGAGRLPPLMKNDPEWAHRQLVIADLNGLYRQHHGDASIADASKSIAYLEQAMHTLGEDWKKHWRQVSGISSVRFD